jgi:hypothetical protein
VTEEEIATEAGACALCGAGDGTPFVRGTDFEYATTGAEFAFFRCECGGVFLHPRPAPASLARAYPSNNYSCDFANKLGPLVMRFTALTERAKVRAYRQYLDRGSRVLDVGCGDGHVLQQIADSVPVPRELEGGGVLWSCRRASIEFPGTPGAPPDPSDEGRPHARPWMAPACRGVPS